mmetsp:Transcript_3465/g.3976  ORF Transcript_3465/g.3976 Transcript_3465/m.3976 type:complete len:517 (-) Transcript_3465:679-2229(-)
MTDSVLTAPDDLSPPQSDPPSDPSPSEPASDPPYPSGKASWPHSRLFFRYPTPLATGWALESAMRGPHLMSNIFVAKALLDYATMEAGCDPNTTDVDGPCESRVHGFLPSSLLTNMVLVSGLLGAALMPVVGSVVDHTKHRRLVGRASWVGLVLVHATLMCASERNWLWMAGVQVCGRVVDLTHLMVSYAYLPEITDDSVELSRLSSSFNVKQYGCGAVFLGCVGAAAYVLNLKSGGTVVLSQITVLTITLLLGATAWCSNLFPPRAALSAVPKGSYVITAGFRKLADTGSKIITKYRPLRWMIVTMMLAEAASNTFTQIAITYTSEVLAMSANQVSATIFVLLLAIVPGSAFMAYLSNKLDPIRSYRLSLFYFGSVQLLASILLQSPANANLCYAFAAAWGFGFGWMHPAQRVLFATIIPHGQETEMMGIYTFSGQALLFLPPLLFSMLNEAGYHMSIGLGSLSVFFLGASVCAGGIGSYGEATKFMGRAGSSGDKAQAEESVEVGPKTIVATNL